jgi:hypothetical protein
MRNGAIIIGLIAALSAVSLTGCTTTQHRLQAQIHSQQEAIDSQQAAIVELTRQVAQLEETNHSLQSSADEYAVRIRDLEARIAASIEQHDGLPVASIEISVDPAHIVCKSGQYHWDLVLLETDGVGVSIASITVTYYFPDGTVAGQKSHTHASDPSWFPTYLATGQEYRVGAGALRGNPNRFAYTVEGFDNNGHRITATAEFELG